MHPDFSIDNFRNDIAVLDLSERPLKLSDTIKRVCLPEVGFDPQGVEAIVAGWGDTTGNGDVASNDLKEAQLQ